MIIATLLFAGLLVSELCELQYRDLPIKHGKNEIVVRQGKRKKYGTIHISEYLTDLLNGFVGRPKSSLRDTDWVFKNEAEKKYTRQQIWNIVNRIGRKLNMEFLHPHCLRHTYASILLFDTKDQHFVRRQLRHVNSSTTDIYVGAILMKINEDTPQEILNLLKAINPLRE